MIRDRLTMLLKLQGLAIRCLVTTKTGDSLSRFQDQSKTGNSFNSLQTDDFKHRWLETSPLQSCGIAAFTMGGIFIVRRLIVVPRGVCCFIQKNVQSKKHYLWLYLHSTARKVFVLTPQFIFHRGEGGSLSIFSSVKHRFTSYAFRLFICLFIAYCPSQFFYYSYVDVIISGKVLLYI